MKKILFSIALFSSFYLHAQTTIVEEKFEKDNKPVEFEILKNENEVLVKKGKAYGSIRGINKVDLFSLDNLKGTKIVENGKFLDFKPSTIDNTFVGTEFNGVGWVSSTKIFENNKLIATLDSNKNFFLFSKEFSYSVGNEKNKYLDNIEKGNLFLHKYNNKLKKTQVIKLDKPSFFTVNKKDFYNLDEVAYKIFYHKNSFDVTTKFINKDARSFVFHRAIYDLDGKNTKTLSYNINVGKPLILSNNSGGEIDSNYNSLSKSFNDKFADQLSINNYYLDEDTNDIYVYGLFGKKDERLVNNEVGGYYVIKFDSEGKQVWQKVQEISDAEMNRNASKLRLSNGFRIENGQGVFSIFQYYSAEYYFYSQLDLSTGAIKSSQKISFDVDKMWESEYRNSQVVAFFNLKEYKKLKLDFDTMHLNSTDKRIQNYLVELNKSKDKISVNCLVSNKGNWLIESDNDKYYKITFFEK
ncbi:hypothetical protein [Flavobacterium mesophilum]|uniref:hypothetical protein n=1 Tax=Flavobacterium mesophilum TaxID=3143495 RepID=UPI0031D8D85A